LIIARIYWFV